jgi:lipopolysaccharide heptosyltransferase II
VTAPWDGVRRILAVRLDNLGDVLMSTPALSALKASFPGAQLTLMASPSGAAITPFLPCIDDVIVYDAPWVKSNGTAEGSADLAMAERLRSMAFDAAVIFTVYSQSALPAAMLCRFAGIPRVLAHCRENPYRLLTDWVRDTAVEDNGRHETQRQLDLVRTVGATVADERLVFRVAPADRASLRTKLAARGVAAERGWTLVHPGATAPSRRYPAERFATVARTLTDDGRGPVLVTGGPDEAELAGAVAAQAGPGVISIAGALTLGEFAALIADAALLVSNNSGPVHLAAALGTPVVDLYALTNPQHTPWQVSSRVLFHDVPCKFCYRSECPQGHHQCLRGVTPETVIAAARELHTEAHPLEPAA